MKKLISLFVLFFLFSGFCFGQESNPDGKIGKPTVTILGGLRTGDSKFTLSENGLSVKRDGEFSGSGVWINLTYPTSRSLSLIFQFNADWQNSEYPVTRDFYRQESKFTTYGFVFGLRFFTQ